jgi:hypothetical protein
MTCVGLFLTISVPSSVGSQVNIEKVRGADVGEGLSTNLHLMFSTRSGNVDITELGLDVRTDFVAERSTSFLVLRGVYGWQDGDAFSNEGLVHLRHVRKRWRTLRPEAFTQIDYDKARRLTFRSLGGMGLRLVLFEKDELDIAWGTAYMIEHERFDLPQASLHSRSNTHHRWSNYISLKASFNEETALIWTSYLQPRFDDFGDLKMLGEGVLETELTKVFSLTVTGRFRYDSVPPERIAKLDTLLAVGLLVKI